MKRILLLFLIIPVLVLGSCEPGEEGGAVYSITVGATEGGRAAATLDGAEVAEAAEGATISLVAEAVEGYVFDKWTTETAGVVFANETAIYTTFTMPGADVAIEAAFRTANGTIYKVTITDDGNGSAVATIGDEEVDEAPEGTTVTITATPAPGYMFDKWTSDSEGVTIKNPEAALTTFVMPSGDVSIAVGFLKVPQSITFTGTGGTAVAMVDRLPVVKAEEGTTVTITATANAGYKFERWTSDDDLNFDDDESEITTFTMPGKSVVIGMEFADIDPDVLGEISDPVFKAYCEAAMTTAYQYLNPVGGGILSHPAWDTNGNGLLSSGEAAAVKAINMVRSGGSTPAAGNLDGIDVFAGLEVLYCNGHALTTLDVSGNTKLAALVFNDNDITSFDVSGCAYLLYLSCSGNGLASFDLSDNVSLAALYCNNNALESLDLSDNQVLAIVDCFKNELTSLDVSDNPVLSSLNCADNKLESLIVSNNPALAKLQCNNNELTTLDVSNVTALDELLCYNNSLTSLIVGGDTYVQHINCAQNQLTTLDVSGSRYLGRLDCKNNRLTSINISGCQSLSFLYCYDNELTALDMTGCEVLYHLHCYNNRMSTLNIANMPVLYESNLYHAYCGLQTSDGTTPLTLTLSMREGHKEYWDSKLASDGKNGNVVVSNTFIED